MNRGIFNEISVSYRVGYIQTKFGYTALYEILATKFYQGGKNV